MTTYGTYSEEHNGNTLEIKYEHTYMSATYLDQEVDEVEITKVIANGNDITDIYWNFFDTDVLQDKVNDYAKAF